MIGVTLPVGTAGRPVCVAIGDPVGGTTRTCTDKSVREDIGRIGIHHQNTVVSWSGETRPICSDVELRSITATYWGSVTSRCLQCSGELRDSGED